MSLLSASEVFQFAIRIEENGEKFYRTFAQNLQRNLEKEMFNFLADEEAKHIKIFENMLNEFEKYKPTISYPDEYFEYLRAYTDNIIFTKDALEKEVSKIKDAKTACDFGIRRELDSILYYQDIKSLVPKKKSHLIDNIISEERRHFLKLTQMKKEL